VISHIPYRWLYRYIALMYDLPYRYPKSISHIDIASYLATVPHCTAHVITCEGESHGLACGGQGESMVPPDTHDSGSPSV
jgi:hypothetical protein